MTPRVRPAGEGGGWPPPQWGLSGPAYSLSLQRGLAILAAFTPERPVLGLMDIARELEMHKGTTHRYVSTLVALGYLEQDARRKYRLTLGVTRLGLSALSASNLKEHAHPYMQDLANSCGYGIDLAVLDGMEILQLDLVHSTRHRQTALNAHPQAGSRLPLHCTATGKLLLTELPKKERTALLRELTLTRHTPKTITGRRALREEIQRIAHQGMAVNDEELTPGHHAIAAPVRSADREAMAALGMSAPTTAINMENLVAHLTPHLIAIADRISARLGYRRPDEHHRNT